MPDPNSFLVEDGWAIGNLILVTQTQTQTQRGPAALTDQERAKLDKLIGKIDKNLEKKNKKGKLGSCAQFLQDHGISIEAVEKMLNDQQAFSGDRSTNAIGDAGLFSPTGIRELKSETDPGKLSNNLSFLNKNVNDYLDDLFGRGSRVKAVSAIYASSPVVYYRDFEFTTALHEILHLLTGKEDSELHEQLLGTPMANPAASEEITQALKDHGCQ